MSGRPCAENTGTYVSSTTLKGIIMKSIIKFMREEDGVTAIEYGLIAALIAVVIIASVTTVGEALKAIFEHITTELETPLAVAP
jgi:pilus assembly protein Flp/PilA